STPSTRSPRASSARATWCPMKPATPVTKMVTPRSCPVLPPRHAAAAASTPATTVAPEGILLRQPAPVDRKRRPGDRAGRLGAKKHRQRADLIGRRELPHRLLLREHVLGHLLEPAPLRGGPVPQLLFDQRGPHPAGADGIDGHAAVGELDRRHLR